MLSRRVALAICVMCLSAGVAGAQQNVPPPPKPADDGPSLADTMKFIQDKLNSQDVTRFSYVERAYNHDDAHRELKNVSADPVSCTFQYTQVETILNDVAHPDDLPVFNTAFAGSFKDVENITVGSLADTQEFLATPEIGPDLFRISLNATRKVFKFNGRQFVNQMPLDVRDEDMANRVAKAITHAVELCKAMPEPKSDAKPEPF